MLQTAVACVNLYARPEMSLLSKLADVLRPRMTTLMPAGVKLRYQLLHQRLELEQHLKMVSYEEGRSCWELT